MLSTFRNELIHFLVCVGLSLAFAPQLGVLNSFLVIFAFGFFLDLDHLFDYGFYLSRRKKKFKISEFLSGQHFAESHKMFVFLHSWELVILLWIPYLYFGQIAFWAASLALLSHLIVDQFTNQVAPPAYFLFYRFIISFKHL